MPGPLIWVLIAGGSALGLWGCDDDTAGDDRDLGPMLNDAGAFGNPGQGFTNPNACKLPPLNSDKTQSYHKDIFIMETPQAANECTTVEAGLAIADKNDASVHFQAGDVHKESFKVPAVFKQLSFTTDFTEDNKERAILVPEEQNGDTIMTLEKAAAPADADHPVTMVEVSELVFDGLQESVAIHQEGGEKPVHKEDYNLKLSNVRIQDAKNGLVADGQSRIFADNLEILHPNRAVTLGLGAEGVFKKLTIRDSGDPAEDHLFAADNAARLSIEELLVSNTLSYDSIFSIKADFLQFYGAVFMNNETYASVLDMNLGQLAAPHVDQQHLLGSVLIVNNDADESVVKLRTQDTVTIHNLGIHGNYGVFNNIVDAFNPSDNAPNTGPKYIINSSITDNTPFDGVLKSVVISGVDISSQNGGVVVDGSNIYNNGLENQSYGPNNWSLEHCGKGSGYIMKNGQELKPDAFDLVEGTHETCALINGGANHGYYSNNDDDTIGHVGAYGGWKEYVLKAVEKTILELY